MMVGYFILAGFIFIVDRVTKFAALSYCIDPIYYNDFMSCQLTFNRGISWGMFHSSNDRIFWVVSFIIGTLTVGLLIYAIQRARAGFLVIGETLVVTGSFSNIIDRIFYQGVIDFMQLSYHEWIWPSFNVADCCIVVGVGIMFIQHMRSPQ